MNESCRGAKKTAVALGMFDGLHKGHRAVLNSALHSGFSPVAVTFDKLPKCGGMIMHAVSKKRLLYDMGFERVEVLEFSRIKDMSPLDFLLFIRSEFDPGMLCCGFNYSFGVNASGNADTLSYFCRETNVKLSLSPPVKDEKGRVISSSLIRGMISSGDIESANALMMYPFTIEGEVVRGDGRGTNLGFATVNIMLPEWLTIPRFGVYKTSVAIDNRVFGSITDIGHRPTFPSEKTICETHIFDFNGDLYGKNVAVRLERFIRPEQKFSSAARLAEQIRNDIKKLKQEK